jgi:hypothetical protein
MIMRFFFFLVIQQDFDYLPLQAVMIKLLLPTAWASTPFVIQNKALLALSPYDSRLEILHSLTSRIPIGECKILDVNHTKVTTARKPFIYLLQNVITIATRDLIPTLCCLARTIS